MKRQLYKDMQPIERGLVRPERRDDLPLPQWFSTFVALFVRDFVETMTIMGSEIYIDLIKLRKWAETCWEVRLTFRSDRSLEGMVRTVLMSFSWMKSFTKLIIMLPGTSIVIMEDSPSIRQWSWSWGASPHRSCSLSMALDSDVWAGTGTLRFFLLLEKIFQEAVFAGINIAQGEGVWPNWSCVEELGKTLFLNQDLSNWCDQRRKCDTQTCGGRRSPRRTVGMNSSINRVCWWRGYGTMNNLIRGRWSGAAKMGWVWVWGFYAYFAHEVTYLTMNYFHSEILHWSIENDLFEREDSKISMLWSLWSQGVYGGCSSQLSPKKNWQRGERHYGNSY